MFLRNSRYKDSRVFTSPSTFEGVRPRAIGDATGVLEYTVKSGDRLDTLARHFFNDDRLWWRILDANPDLTRAQRFNLDDLEGEIIVIPRLQE